MKRIVPALAAVVLGSGCVVTTDTCDGTLTVDWSYFKDADGFTYSGCPAYVAGVNVYVDGVPYSAACGDYAMVISVAEGTHDVVIEEVDAAGYPLYRDSYSSTSVACGLDTPVDSIPAEGWLDITTTFASGYCDSYYPSYLWFSILDRTRNIVTWNSLDSMDTTYDTCTYDGGIWLRLPKGSYTLQGVEEDYYSSGAWRVARHDCMNTPFTIYGGLKTYESAYLYTSTSTCF